MKRILYKKNFNIEHNEIILVPLGDIHFGHANCDIANFEKTLDWIYKTKNAYVIGMGDLLDVSIRSSPGASVYEQEMNVQGQLEQMVAYLKPIADEGRLLGLLDGNHEARIQKETGLCLTKIMSQMLNVDYFGYGVNLRLRVEDQIYKIFATHGNSNAKLLHTKIKPCLDLENKYEADVYLHGHVHCFAHLEKPYYIQDSKHMRMKEEIKHFILTGAFLKFFDSYAEKMQLQPSKQNTPIIKLSSLEKLIEVAQFK